MSRDSKERDVSEPSASRRKYMQLAGASIPIVGSVTWASTSAAQSAVGGPSNADDWEITFEDTFSGNSINTDNWEVGFGWGMETNASTESIASEHVNVEDGYLHISASPDNGVEAGCINSKDKVTVEPGTYIEARLRAPKRDGFLPAFWGKPNSEAWPPEIDIFELFQNGDGREDWTTANYNIHYSTSTDPGDSSSHESDPTRYDTGTDLSTEFHVYGCKWLSDRVEFYFDGEKIGESTDPTAMEALRRGAPFYLMLNIHIDKIGTTDKSESWDEELVVDWVRVWNSSAEDTSENTEETDPSRNYFWARSGDGNPVTFEFASSGGNIHLDSSSYDADYWIGENGQSAGGTTDHTGGQLPGLWYDGEIVEFTYDGELDLYINDQQVDPATLSTDDGGDNTDDAGSDDSDGSSSTGNNDESTSTESRLLIDGTRRADKTARYIVSVSGDIERDQEHSSLADGGLVWDSVTDHVGDGQAVGIVGNGVDAYRFTGTLQEIEISGHATFSVEQV